MLQEFLHRYPRWVVLTGAGISAASGIPTYRNDRGEWQRSEPIQHRDFIEQAAKRRRYWARSMAGWGFVGSAQPNAAHRELVRLEQAGHITLLATQNVDRLHQRVGHRHVIDLHGRLDRVTCLDCAAMIERAAFQQELESLNPGWSRQVAAQRPDGDADVADAIVEAMQVPDCAACGGMLMPDVVFFGGSVPRGRIAAIEAAIREADALVVLGSSLTVYSGFRFCRMADAMNKPLAIINRGATRADDLAALCIQRDIASTLAELQLSASSIPTI